MFLVFIGGQSASGKTGLSHKLLQKLNASGESAQLLNMDDYYCERPENIDEEEFRQITNFDRPESLDLNLLKEHILQLAKGNSITKPLFVFKSNRREGQEIINPSEVMIIEGLFGQYFCKEFLPQELRTLSVNVATESYLDIVERRIKRDMEQRNRARHEVIRHERKYVGPGFLKYTASSATSSDIYISNKKAAKHELILDSAVDEIILKLHQKSQEMRNSSPDVQEMIAKSHQLAGNLDNHSRFEKSFNGVFGAFSGVYQKEFTPEEINRADLVSDLREYISKLNKSENRFSFSANNKANSHLARQLLNDLLIAPQRPVHEVFESVVTQREEMRLKNADDQLDISHNGINCEELNAIINKAQKLVSVVNSSGSFPKLL